MIRDPRVEPISDHKGHDIGSNSAAGESFVVCKTCCIEVYDDSKDINPLKVKIVNWDDEKFEFD